MNGKRKTKERALHGVDRVVASVGVNELGIPGNLNIYVVAKSSVIFRASIIGLGLRKILPHTGHMDWPTTNRQISDSPANLVPDRHNAVHSCHA
jgi:hypothetical protein